ncbi:hypothetical protein [Roseivirga pacifica]|uniref:hypothetical protein n=1 Tax=Roseivirga pacifica TaxID=1267423 RepID=UPI002095C19C|nr:hypothetical protein [Roseivirga pacifica]
MIQKRSQKRAAAKNTSQGVIALGKAYHSLSISVTAAGAICTQATASISLVNSILNHKSQYHG